MEALAAVPVSTLCDVDKSLPVVDPAIRPLTLRPGSAGRRTRSWRRASSSRCCTRSARPRPATCSWSQAGGAPLAALGELLATEAWRRGLGGIVVDGYVRDRTGLPPDLPLWARGTVPMAGRSDVAPRVGGPILFGGVRVAPGDLVRRRRRRDRDRAARAARGVPRARRARSSASRPRCSPRCRAARPDRHDQPRRARRRAAGAASRARSRSRRRAELELDVAEGERSRRRPRETMRRMPGAAVARCS